MFLIVLADFGKLFTRGIKFLWAFVRRLYYTGSCRKVRRTVPVQVKHANLEKKKNEEGTSLDSPSGIHLDVEDPSKMLRVVSLSSVFFFDLLHLFLFRFIAIAIM